MKKILFLILILLFGFTECKTKKEQIKSDNQSSMTEQSIPEQKTENIQRIERPIGGVRALPPIIIYKTKKNYNNLVPITLSPDKKQIFSYPAPTDVKVGDRYQTPIELENNYLLDRRGITIYSAFLDITYEDYAKLKELLSHEDMLKHVIDNDPFIEVCNCGVEGRFQNTQAELNRAILDGSLYEICKKIEVKP